MPYNREKSELGELGDWELIDWNSLNRVSGGFKGRTKSE